MGIGDPPRTAYRHRVFYAGRDVRDLAPSGLVDYVPISLADVPRMFTDGHLPIDVALVQVAPPDDDDSCSLGVSVDITKAAVLMLKVFRRGVGHTLRMDADAGVYEVRMRFTDEAGPS